MIKKIMIFIFGYLSKYIWSCTSNKNLQFLSRVIIIKPKLLPLLFPNTFKLFGFQIFWLWANLMNVIP